MIRARAVWLFLLPSLALAADWRDQLTASEPGKFPLPRPATAFYRFGWSSFPAAQMEVSLRAEKDDELHLSARGRTTGLVRGLWRLDVTHDSRVSKMTLLPLATRQVETYRSEKLITQLEFTAEKVMRLREAKPPDKSPPRWKRFKFPNVRDLHSALVFMRSKPMQKGDTVSMVVYPTTAPYLAEVHVIGKETVHVPAGEFRAIKTELKLWRINKERDFALEPHTNFKRAYAWVSDDADRLLVKATAEIFVGSVSAELERVEFSGR